MEVERAVYSRLRKLHLRFTNLPEFTVDSNYCQK